MVDQSVPAWLQALLQQVYPGRNEMTPDEMQMLVNSRTPPQGYGNPAGANSQPIPGNLAPTFQQNAIPSGAGPRNMDPRFIDRTINAMGSPMGANTPLPPPDPRRLGGASSQSANSPIPSPQNTNRTTNNPRWDTFQSQVPGMGVGPLSRNPMFTTFNPWGQA
jgi:hypothetical protein